MNVNKFMCVSIPNQHRFIFYIFKGSTVDEPVDGLDPPGSPWCQACKLRSRRPVPSGGPQGGTWFESLSLEDWLHLDEVC